MSKQIRVEIVGRDEFWSNAVLVEWKHRYPERQLVSEANGWYMIDTEWLDSLKDVATDCNAKVVPGPNDPSRRSLFRQFLPFQNETGASRSR
jgi:hypothetical protein